MESRATNSAGAPDFDFGNGGRYYLDTEPFGAMVTEGVVCMPDGKIRVVGTQPFDPHDSRSLRGFAVAGLTEAGQPDEDFGATAAGLTLLSFMPGSHSWGGAIARTHDNKLIVSGLIDVGPVYETLTPALARLHEDGRLDESFGGGGGKVWFTFPPPPGVSSISPRRAPSLRESEEIAGDIATFTFQVTPLTNGKLVISGALQGRGRPSRYSVLARLDENGLLDRTFGLGGYSYVHGLGSLVDSHHVLPDGSVLVCGHLRMTYSETIYENIAYVAKFLENGLPDMSYGSGGIGYHETLFHFRTMSGVDSLVVHDGGKVVLVGNGQIAYSSPWNGVLGGLDAAGRVDSGFNGGERAEIPPVDGMRIHITDSLPDGDGLLVYGVVGQTQGMTRYRFDGSMDTGFGSDGWWLYGATRFAQGMARQPDGKIVALGAVDSGGFQTTDYISRFLGS